MFMRGVIVYLVWLLLAGVASAQVKIVGETNVQPYKLVRLQATGMPVKSNAAWEVWPRGKADVAASADRTKVEFVAEPGVYDVELLVFSLDESGIPVLDRHWTKVTIGKAKPDPEPEPDPDPKPDPKPITKAWVVIVEESEDARDSRGQFVTDKALSEYVKAKGWKLRMTDKDVLNPDGKVPADLEPYILRAKSKGLPYFCVVDQDGTIRTEGTLPDKASDFLATLKKVGG